MVPTSIPVSHNGFYQNTYGGSSQPSCFLFFFGDGCLVDVSKAKGWLGVSGTAQVAKDTGDSILATSKSLKDFAVSSDKIALLLPFIILMLAFGLAIGWSKGHRYFA